ncbi:hypothetical protein KALB_6456 [Kutzneria albida DSM 43870]|uniref:Dephospho-CoA kinase n=1 Tax=Kutzneria albida DSM 43870 TaxID=1449976 RepID=W5WGD4_9PSEU|nr:hypothetical protein KALB_6456 [Kutzneria albida DSM 43870]
MSTLGAVLKIAVLDAEVDLGKDFHVVPELGGPLALVLAAHPPADPRVVDLVLAGTDLDQLKRTRLEPFAQNVANRRFAVSTGSPELAEWDPSWSITAERLLNRLRSALPGWPGLRWDHIGSTSVPGLAAKPIIDLQLGVPCLDQLDGLDEALLAVGFTDVALLAPDSPGVLRDAQRGATGPDARWDKRLFASADPGQRAILHVRQIDSPWWRYTTRFRDLLRADPVVRHDYEQAKRQLTDGRSYDAYTVAKTAFFDTIQARLDEPVS